MCLTGVMVLSGVGTAWRTAPRWRRGLDASKCLLRKIATARQPGLDARRGHLAPIERPEEETAALREWLGA